MEELTLVIGNCNYSSWSLRPWLFLQQHQIPFHEQRVTLSEPTTREQLSDYFSGDKVPILLTRERQIWDSLAIMEYLAEQYAHSQGWPNDSLARAVARAVSAEMHSSFFAVRNALPMNCRKRFPHYEIASDVQADIDRICEIWRYCRDTFGQNGPALFGDFSIADCMYAPVVVRFVGYDVALDPVCQAYADWLYALPALQAWISRAREEQETIEEEEVDWPSESV